MKNYLPLLIALLMSSIACNDAKDSTSHLGKAEAVNHQQLPPEFSFHEGDLIFHTSKSSQSKAIQLATNSPYSHCGIVFKEGDKWMVYEAIQPVSKTPLDKWIGRGVKGEYVVNRLKEAEQKLLPTTLKRLKTESEKFMGKDYDTAFGWSDDRIYCSELIWKVYKSATGLEVGKLEKLGDFDLTSPTVKQLLNKRYGNKIPLNEQVISPKSVFESPLLETVFSN